jgi:ankyrin repeat protein
MLLVAAIAFAFPMARGFAQTPPGADEIKAYTGLHAAAAKGDVAEIERLIAAGNKPIRTDRNRRSPLHVAAFAGQHAAARALLRHGADPNALDAQRYDIVTIAAVANDLEMLRIALDGGASASNVTSPYDGTALIAAAHLGHAAVVRMLIAAKAPLDHINNLGWTALIEAVVLGNGGSDHIATVEALVAAGANPNITDRNGRTALDLAQARNYTAIADIIKAAAAR